MSTLRSGSFQSGAEAKQTDTNWITRSRYRWLNHLFIPDDSRMTSARYVWLSNGSDWGTSDSRMSLGRSVFVGDEMMAGWNPPDARGGEEMFPLVDPVGCLFLLRSQPLVDIWKRSKYFYSASYSLKNCCWHIQPFQSTPAEIQNFQSSPP